MTISTLTHYLVKLKTRFWNLLIEVQVSIKKVVNRGEERLGENPHQEVET